MEERADVDSVVICPSLYGVEEIGEEATIGLGIDADGVDWRLEDGTDLALFGGCSAMVPFAWDLLWLGGSGS